MNHTVSLRILPRHVNSLPAGFSGITAGILILVLCILFALPGCDSHGKNDKRLPEVLDSLMAVTYQPSEPGACVLVVKEGITIFRKAYGLADYKTKELLTPDHVFNIGSITKQFTAQAILLLDQQGKLSIHDPLSEYVPDFPGGEMISIENLLTHTSGITDVFEVAEWFPLWQKELTPREFIDVFRKRPLRYKPGTQYYYSNVNYGLLGYIIERVSGESYRDFITRNFFLPLGMKQSCIPRNVDPIYELAHGYYKTNEGITNADTINYSHLLAAGSIFSCVDDMAKWYIWLAGKYRAGDPKVKKALTNYIFPDGSSSVNGYGFWLYDLQGRPAAGNNGGMLGYSNYTLWMYEDDIIIILLTNIRYEGDDQHIKTSYDPATMARKLASAAMGVTGKPASANYIPIPAEDLDRYTGVYRVSEDVYRIVFRKGDQLYTMRSDNGTKKPIHPLSPNRFVTADGSTFDFVFDESGKAVEANWNNPDGSMSIARLTGLPIPKGKEPVPISRESLQAVCGTYKMMAVFEVRVSMADSGSILVESKQRGNKIFYPESSNRFFLSDNDQVTIDFITDKDGQVAEFSMISGGRTFSARKEIR